MQGGVTLRPAGEVRDGERRSPSSAPSAPKDDAGDGHAPTSRRTACDWLRATTPKTTAGANRGTKAARPQHRQRWRVRCAPRAPAPRRAGRAGRAGRDSRAGPSSRAMAAQSAGQQAPLAEAASPSRVGRAAGRWAGARSSAGWSSSTATTVMVAGALGLDGCGVMSTASRAATASATQYAGPVWRRHRPPRVARALEAAAALSNTAAGARRC